jgi:hypothetical protein
VQASSGRPRTDAVARVSIPYLPTGVSANAGEVW